MPSVDQKIRIGLADDHPIFLDSLRKLLSLDEDFEVVAEVNSGEDVVDMLRRHEPDILLLDLRMPQRGGLDTLREIQAANLNTKVVVLTASDDQNDYIEAIRTGAKGIVHKQTATESLVESIREVHGGEIWLDAKARAVVSAELGSSPRRRLRPAGRGELTRREKQIVQLVSQGLKNRDLASRLEISEHTVKHHLHNIFNKLGVSDRVELALYALQRNLGNAECEDL